MDDTIPQETPQGKYYVYALAYPDERIFYIGKGCDFRILDHEQEAKKLTEKKGNTYKLNTIRKIWRGGGEVLKLKLAFFDDEEEAYAYEIALIFFLPNLTNLTSGGDGMRPITEETRQKLRENGRKNRGMPKPEEWKKKISEANRKRRLTEESRKKISATKTGNTHHTAESRKKISEAGKGRKWTESQRAKMTGRPLTPTQREALSRANKGRIVSPETRRKISENRKPPIFTEEMRQKASQARKGRPKPEGFGRKISEARKGLRSSEESRERLRQTRIELDLGKENRESVERLLREDPTLATGKIAKIIGCSRPTALRWKKHFFSQLESECAPGE